MIFGCGGGDWRTKWVQENGNEVRILEPVGLSGVHTVYSAESTTTGKTLSVSHDTKKPLVRNKTYKINPRETWNVLTTTIAVKDE
jgi:hypothetical protein